MRVGLVVKAWLLLAIFNASFAHAQTTSRQVGAILEQQIQVPAVTAFQLGQYLAAKIPTLPAPRSADQWTAEAKRLRRHILEDIAFHGWAREWVEAPLKFRDL